MVFPWLFQIGGPVYMLYIFIASLFSGPLICYCHSWNSSPPISHVLINSTGPPQPVHITICVGSLARRLLICC
ncbi:hypothetical protein EDD15DRAFT_2311251, partial [Pisolithus albus]